MCAHTCFTPLLLIQLFKTSILVLDWEDDVFIADGSLGPGRIELSQTLASGDDCMKEHGGVAFSKNLDNKFRPCTPSNAISFLWWS